MDNWVYCYECVYFDTCESRGQNDSKGCYFGKTEEDVDERK